ALGLQVTTVGPNDGNGLFQAFMIANGGGNIVTPDGQLHTSDPKVREAAIKSCAYLTDAYKQGYIPPEALSWNDADANNGFHEKLFVVDFDCTSSTELAMIKDTQAYMHDVVTMGLPNGNNGQPMAAQTGWRWLHSKGSEKRRGRQGSHEVLDATQGHERQPEGWPWTVGAGHTADCQGRPVVDRSRGPAPRPLCARGRARAND